MLIALLGQALLNFVLRDLIMITSWASQRQIVNLVLLESIALDKATKLQMESVMLDSSV